MNSISKFFVRSQFNFIETVGISLLSIALVNHKFSLVFLFAMIWIVSTTLRVWFREYH